MACAQNLDVHFLTISWLSNQSRLVYREFWPQ